MNDWIFGITNFIDTHSMFKFFSRPFQQNLRFRVNCDVRISPVMPETYQRQKSI
jgi:hypothetical protein